MTLDPIIPYDCNAAVAALGAASVEDGFRCKAESVGKATTVPAAFGIAKQSLARTSQRGRRREAGRYRRGDRGQLELGLRDRTAPSGSWITPSDAASAPKHATQRLAPEWLRLRLPLPASADWCRAAALTLSDLLAAPGFSLFRASTSHERGHAQAPAPDAAA